MRGIEYQWRWQPFDATRLVVNQTFIHSDAEFMGSALANPTNSLWAINNAGAYEKRANIDELAERGAPRHSTSVLLMQKMPFGVEFSVAGYWQDKMKWSVNTWSEKYHRVDVRLGYPFHLGSQRGELAYIVQSLDGAHPEYKAYNDPADRVVERRQWVTLRLDF